MISGGAGKADMWLAALGKAFPDLADRVRQGTIAESMRGAVGLPNHRRRAAGPGWALVGDAGYHRDPITGHGMTDAFRDAELLAAAAHDALTGQASESEALGRYESERDAALADIFALTRDLAAFPTPDRFMEIQIELSRALDAEALGLAARPLFTGERDRTSVGAVA